MQVITIESQAFQDLMSKIDNLENKFEEISRKATTPLGEKWLDNQDVCLELKISKRTLQYYREESLIPYSMIKHKIFYRAKDVNAFLMSNYHKSKMF